MGQRAGRPTWMSPGEFQTLAAKHPTAVRGLGILKQFVHDATESLSEPDRVIRWTITTGNVDRDRDVVVPGGVKTDSYLKNPIVLFGHDYTNLPVAKTLKLAQNGNKWSADAQFATHDLYPFADTVYRMTKAGFLNASSIGFKPMEWTLNEERKGVDFMSIELLEWSIVPVPAHPEALVEARSMGIEIEPLKEWAEKILDTWTEDSGLLVPRAQAEAVYRIASGCAVLVPKPEASAAERQDPASGEPEQPLTKAVLPPEDSELISKRGRVLSAANEKKLRDAHAMIGDVCAQVDPKEDTEEDTIDVIANKAEEGVIETVDAEPVVLPETPLPTKELLIDIDPDMLQTVLARLVVSTVAQTVRERTDRAINAARGRVD